MSEADSRDIPAIGSLIDGLFAALSWNPDSPPNWDRSLASFMPDAKLIPSARPLAPKSAKDFAETMQGQRESGDMKYFEEKSLKNTVELYGNMAVVINTFQSVINQGEPGRGVNAMLLVKENGKWLVASMTWQGESDDNPIPAKYL